MWTPAALPTVVALASAHGELLNPDYPPLSFEPAKPAKSMGDGSKLEIGDSGGIEPSFTDIPSNAVLLPLDDLFEVRLAAALRVWQQLNGRKPAAPAPLSRQRTERLILALRALDGRQAGATHREIAAALFGPERVAGSSWISHDLRDRTARLVRLGLFLMNGGYRQLLVHPHRRLPRKRKA